ncbi:MAG: hypothetical protein Q4G68_05270 [Planctomycetia bacterium]|nr:hypothetical protein [Planctomycetia bacterium]
MIHSPLTKSLKPSSLFFVLLVVGLSCFAALTQAEEPMIIYNEDNDHFYNLPPECMTREYVERYFNNYADTKITDYFLCLNGQVASFDSKTLQTVWDEIDQYENPSRWMANAKLLHDRGVDFYAVGVERCRANGISPWISIRMNDVHCVGVKPRHFRTTRHYEEHPELWRVPDAVEKKISDWNAYAYNYSRKEVRDYYLALVQEVLERYDMDGLELDWMRFGYHLTPGKEREEAVFLTEFVRQARVLTNEASEKRGHPVQLAVRIPQTVETALGLGMDGITWAKEGLIDVMTVSTFLSADFNTPIQQWKDELGDAATTVKIVPATDNGIYSYAQRRVYTDAALVYGWANTMYWQGANAFYLFNYPYTAGDNPGLGTWQMLTTGLSRETVLRAQRRHPVSLRDFVLYGMSSECQLPKKTDTNLKFSVQIGQKPDRGRAHVCLAFTEGENLNETAIRLKLNGHETPMVTDILYSPTDCFGEKIARAVSFEFSHEQLIDGINEITLEATEFPQELVWVEIRCGY